MTRQDATIYMLTIRDIPVREMSKMLFNFSRHVARLADPHRVELDCFNEFRPASWGSTVPQSPKLKSALVAKIADPMADFFTYFA